MKLCPQCRRTFRDDALAFCLYDGHALAPAVDAAPAPPPVQPPPVQPPTAPMPTAPPPAIPSAIPPAAPPAGQPVAVPPTTPPQAGPGRWVVGGLAALLAFGWLGRHASHPAGPGTPASPGAPTSPGAPVSPGTPPADPSAPPGDTGSPASPGAAPDGRADILAAVQRADDATVQADKTLDDTPLAQFYTGDALAKQEATLQSLRRVSVYADLRLVDTQVRDVAQSQDGQQAQVRLTETWSITLVSQMTGQPLRTVPSTVLPQTISLRRGGGGWVVTDSVPDKPQANGP